MKTAREHAEEFLRTYNPLDSREYSILEFIQRIFDSCIEVAMDEAHTETVANRYKGESHKQGQRTAESICKQLRSLRGE